MATGSIVCAPVSSRDCSILERNEPDIVKLMDPDKISRLLIEKGILDSNDRKQILQGAQLCDRNRALLGVLLTRGPDAYKNYINALEVSDTDNHVRLARILKNEETPAPHQLPIDHKLQDSRHKRMSEKLDNHEQRLHTLEEEVLNDARSSDDDIKVELERRSTELEEMRKELKTRERELQDAKEENKVLQKRIQTLEKKIQTLETYLRDQKVKVETLTKQQQMDRRNLKALEDKNSKLEARVENAEKKMEKKLLEQEKRHHKEMEEIKQLILNTKPSDANSKNATKPAPNPKPSTGPAQKVILVPKNRFQNSSDESAASASKAVTSSSSSSYAKDGGSVSASKAVISWKKSVPVSDKHVMADKGKKKK